MSGLSFGGSELLLCLPPRCPLGAQLLLNIMLVARECMQMRMRRPWRRRGRGELLSSGGEIGRWRREGELGERCCREATACDGDVALGGRWRRDHGHARCIGAVGVVHSAIDGRRLLHSPGGTRE